MKSLYLILMLSLTSCATSKIQKLKQAASENWEFMEESLMKANPNLSEKDKAALRLIFDTGVKVGFDACSK